MSRLRRTTNTNKDVYQHNLTDLYDDSVQEQNVEGDSHELITRVKRHRVGVTATGLEFKNGINVAIPDADHVFDVTGDKKSVITKIEALGTYTDSPFAISVGANLIDTTQGLDIEHLSIDNESGFLYKTAIGGMGTKTNFHTDGYINLVSMNPQSCNEVPHDVYHPTNAVDSKLLQKYGMHDLDSLWEGITKFPNESYSYVDKDSVVYKVAQKNTDLLGQLPDESNLIHGKYMMMDNNDILDIVNRIQSGVYAKTPVTTFRDVRIQFTPDGEVSECNFTTTYTASVLFRYTYVVQEPVQTSVGF